MATDPFDAATPYALATWLPARYLRQLPVGDATHDQVASYALGAGRDEAGVVIGGASGLENRWTIDGAPADNLRTGAADTRVPLAFLDGVMVQTGGFSARDRASTGGTIDARLVRGTASHEITVDLWAQASRDPSVRPIPAGSYTLRRVTSTPVPSVSGSVVATGPLPPLPGWLGGSAWYAAGIAPSVSRFDVQWRASRLVDADGNGQADGLPGDVVVAPIEATQTRELDYSVPVMVRTGIDRGLHHVELSLIGQTGRTTRFLGNATLAAAGVDREVTTGDAIATWRGEWADTRARVQLAWHRSTQNESAHDRRAADIPQLLTAYVPATLTDDPVLAAACDDSSPSDPVKSVANCPVPFGFFASGGAGQLTKVTADRPTLTGEVAHRLGPHLARAGATFEDSRLVTTTRFTGNELDHSLFSGELSRVRFYRGTCSTDLTQPCDYAAGSQLNYRTAYAAAYLEDTFSPARGLTIDAGLRWELMWVGTDLHFSRQLAPRLGAVWDPLGGGRSRLWASAGRTFAMLPAGLGSTIIRRDATAEDFDVGGATSRIVTPGTVFRIAPGIESIQQDEVTIGAEIAVAGALRATLWGQGRYLRHGLETTPDGFDNPGGNGEIAATRETEVAAFQLELRRPGAAIRTGVLWGRTVGTWTGPFDPRQGANQLQGVDWNFDSTNLYGPLPTQFGGQFFAEAQAQRSVAGFEVAAALRLSAASGRPRNVLANGIDGIVELLPRGSAGTGPVITQTNLRLAARRGRLGATLDIINLFDRRTVTNLDEIYTDDTVRPIAGGRVGDLVFLRDDTGAPAQRRTAFQLPNAYQAPLSVTFGVHAAF